MTFNGQVIDQRVEGVLSRLSDRFQEEVRVGNDPDKIKSVAFVYLVASIVLGLEDDDVIDGLVEGGGDLGIDAVYFSAPEEYEFEATLIQGKYKRSMEGTAGFPENGVIKIFDAIKTIFDPRATFSANERLARRIEDLRSLIREGNIPNVRVLLTSEITAFCCDFV